MKVAKNKHFGYFEIPMIVSIKFFDWSLSICGGDSRMIDVRILSWRVIAPDDYVLDISNITFSLSAIWLNALLWSSRVRHVMFFSGIEGANSFKMRALVFVGLATTSTCLIKQWKGINLGNNILLKKIKELFKDFNLSTFVIVRNLTIWLIINKLETDI